MWLVACCLVIVPMFSFSVDCTLFCNPRRRSDVLVLLVYMVVVIVGCMLGPQLMFQGHGSYYDLPYSYRWRALAIDASAAIAFAIGLKCTRTLLV